jgi:hypothetical protein
MRKGRASGVAHMARFDLSADGVPAWGDVPFPSDLYRDSEGASALASLPHGAPQGPRDVQTLRPCRRARRRGPRLGASEPSEGLEEGHQGVKLIGREVRCAAVGVGLPVELVEALLVGLEAGVARRGKGFA